MLELVKKALIILGLIMLTIAIFVAAETVLTGFEDLPKFMGALLFGSAGLGLILLGGALDYEEE